jgi:predicted site-specific integrase-resolvase
VKTADAALLAEVSEATIRQWKRRGYLPDVYTAQDVWRCAAERLPKREHARLDRAWEQISSHDEAREAIR